MIHQFYREPSDVDLQLKTQIESLVINWNQHINEVLKQDSSKALQTGFPTPIVELIFWEERVQDLQCIYDQLNEDRVRKMAVILEKTGSTYWPAFKTMFRNVVASLAEAQDILVHLKPFKKVRESDLKDIFINIFSVNYSTWIWFLGLCMTTLSFFSVQ